MRRDAESRSTKSEGTIQYLEKTGLGRGVSQKRKLKPRMTAYKLLTELIGEVGISQAVNTGQKQITREV